MVVSGTSIGSVVVQDPDIPRASTPKWLLEHLDQSGLAPTLPLETAWRVSTILGVARKNDGMIRFRRVSSKLLGYEEALPRADEFRS